MLAPYTNVQTQFDSAVVSDNVVFFFCFAARCSQRGL